MTPQQARKSHCHIRTNSAQQNPTGGSRRATDKSLKSLLTPSKSSAKRPISSASQKAGIARSSFVENNQRKSNLLPTGNDSPTGSAQGKIPPFPTADPKEE